MLLFFVRVDAEDVPDIRAFFGGVEEAGSVLAPRARFRCCEALGMGVADMTDKWQLEVDGE